MLLHTSAYLPVQDQRDAERRVRYGKRLFPESHERQPRALRIFRS